MKRKEPRPQPVPLPLFFFSQLASAASGERVPLEGELACPAGPAAPADGGATGDAAALAPVHRDALPPPTSNDCVNEELWARFTPAAYQARAASLVATERGRTAELGAELEEAWAKVEALIARNTARRAELAAGAIDEQLAAVREKLFWTADEVAQRFSLDKTVGTAADAQVADNARLQLNFSVRPQAPPSDGQSSDQDGGLGGEEQEGTRAAEKELLDPSSHVHCLRRLFAPTLRRRAMFPKELSRLFDEVQTVQSQELPALESVLERLRVMFRIPLYRPFRLLADFIARDLCPPSGTAGIEADGVRTVVEAAHEAEAFTSYLRSTAADRAVLESMTAEERLAIADEMWGKLFHELEAHKLSHAKGLESYHTLTSTISSTHAARTSALDKCDADSQAVMAQLLRDADGCADAVRRSQAQTVSLVDEMDAAYAVSRVELETAVARGESWLAKSEAQQVKLVRRVREAVKELWTEQLRYEEAAQEQLRNRLSLEQLRSSYSQLRDSFQTRHERAQHVEGCATDLMALLRSAETARLHLVSACRQHIARAHHDDYYRQCRLMGKIVQNAKQWSRCVQDIGAVYEDRFTELEGKTRTSWQLNYLAAGQRDWAAGNLLEVRPELTEMRARWAELLPLTQPLDLDVGDLSQTVASGAEDKERLGAMKLLDGPYQVQRRATTLKQYNEKRVRQAAPGELAVSGQAASDTGTM